MISLLLSGPVVEFSSSRSFQSLVCLCVQHCLTENYFSSVRVQFSSDHRIYHDVQRQSKDNNVKQHMFFVVDEQYIYIYTTHFTRLVIFLKLRIDIR